jgi:hypothetical protein
MKITIHVTLDLDAQARDAWATEFGCDNTADAVRSDVKAYMRNQIHTDSFKEAGVPGVSVSVR